ncbi:alpha/beta fold hydrolase [Marinobacter sp. chi1]|uniref:Alpha/beta fold hydrolase n=1 Tax=Marinobacter suaedae TaxID=3057675 RepID=A0ABT8W116_9GAMM|nr:alpha/beta hydrolase [Marinobacter sp. chi1]MDO3721915.1 alpha/beta fold hydrolase [Marinobacter sp. chi1]
MGQKNSIWQLNVLGAPSLQQGSEVVRLKRKKSLALLCYLTLSNRMCSRDTLACLFWPDQDDQNSRMNLRSVVSDLNRVLGHNWAQLNGDSLGIHEQFPLITDLSAMEMALAEPVLPDLDKKTLDHWQAQFMEGFYLAGCDTFDEWLYIQRESTSRTFHALLERMIRRAESHQQSEHLQRLCERMFAVDPLYEHAYAALIRQAWLEDKAEHALSLYQRLADVLDEELGIQPGKELRSLAQSIRNGEPAPARQTFEVSEHDVQMSDVAYARNQSVHIAYKSISSGKPALVVVWGFVSHLDQLTDLPSLESLFLALSEDFTVILFDKRGMGLSDRVAEPASLEDMADDIIHVLDHAGVATATLFGFSEGGPTAITCAHRHPDRISRLILYGTSPKWVKSEDYPYAIPDEAYDRWIEFLENNWGKANNLEHFAPTVGADEQMVRWWSKCIRMSASPGSVRSVLEADRHIDVRDLLPEIKQPTLIIQKNKDRMMRIENGRYLARHLEQAIYMEIEGRDHWFWADNRQAVIEAVKEFGRRYPES